MLLCPPKVESRLRAELSPFLKWAGGKRWLTKSYSHLFPTTYNRYIEPFLGSGAVYFNLRPKKAVLADVNEDLINAYQMIKENWKQVVNLLKVHHACHDKDYYYQVRSSSPSDLMERAARFIYLNRTCWNGLYRVNLKGEFNVPIGTKDKVVLDDDDFEKISKLLKETKLCVSGYAETIEKAQEGDFLFADPPYTVKHNYNGFIKYNENLFSWEDQERLRDCIVEAVGRGVKVLVTNADHESVRKLYKGVGKHVTLDRYSVIAGKSMARGITSELGIICY